MHPIKGTRRLEVEAIPSALSDRPALVGVPASTGPFMPIFVFQKQATDATLWEPRADVYRTPSGWVVKLDLAGVRSEDVKVEVQDAFIRVSGVRRDWIIETGWRHHSMEIAYNRFERVIELPCDSKRCRVSIERQDGMLIVRIERGRGAKYE